MEESAFIAGCLYQKTIDKYENDNGNKIVVDCSIDDSIDTQLVEQILKKKLNEYGACDIYIELEGFRSIQFLIVTTLFY